MTNHTDVDGNMMQYLSILLGLIEAKDWTTFENMALRDPAAFQVITDIISNNPEFNGMTLLHACARYNPPVEIVSHMIMVCPGIVGAQDCIGRTPLHVAAGTGASPRLIRLLVKACPQSCNVQDEDGRTPLHLACDSSCQLFENDDSDERGPPSYDAVLALLKGSLLSATLEDEDEMSALEYAIVSDAPIEVVKLLQKATQKQIKNTLNTDNSDFQRTQRTTVGAPTA